MFSGFQMLMVGFILLAQCGGRINSSGRASVNSTQTQPPPVSQPEKENCDFSDLKTVRVSHFTRAAITKIVKPEYPQEAFDRGIEGFVNVKYLVDVDGNVVRACAVDGDALLRKAAEEAVLRWKFNPSKLGKGGRADIYVRDGHPFHFVLDKGYKPPPEDVAMVIRP